MIPFKDYIREATPNVHMEHIESLVFIDGVAGTRRAINFLIDLMDMLAGNSKSAAIVTVKWDGSPAVFCGIDPADRRFFVSKKGIFNKTPVVYKSVSEIAADTTGDLQLKLTTAFNEFSKLGITSGIYQGDIMFTKGDLKHQTILGQNYVTFHPNTIIYAVPAESDLADKIEQANIGIVWHTTYSGSSLSNLSASFGEEIVPKLKQTPTVWMDDATYKDYSGVATFTEEDTKALKDKLSAIGSLFRTIPASVFDDVSTNKPLLATILKFNNSLIRAGQEPSDFVQHVRNLVDYIQANPGKAGSSMQYFSDHSLEDIASMFELGYMIADAKQIIIDKMDQVSRIPTFVATSDGFKTTGAEGYVAIDRIGGGAVKIVDRMEFSKNNFDPAILKGWQH